MKVLTTPRSYGKADPAVFGMLEGAGLEVIRNTTGGILGKADMKRLLADCEGVIVGVDPLDAEVIAAAPRLKAIAKYGVGVDNIDLEAAKARDIKVSRTVGANAEAVADYAVTLMLTVARRAEAVDAAVNKRNLSHVFIAEKVHEHSRQAEAVAAVRRAAVVKAGQVVFESLRQIFRYYFSVGRHGVCGNQSFFYALSDYYGIAVFALCARGYFQSVP